MFDFPGGFFPFVTAAACAICGVVFLSLNAASKPIKESILAIGAPEAIELYNGRVWGLVTSAFVHQQIWHVFFNLYWLWKLGVAVEARFGPWRLVGFCLLAAVVSSSAQLVFSGTTGIGMSGVLYALFGFVWIGKWRIPAFAALVPNDVIIVFLVWLVGCWIATRLKFAHIGNAAHTAGLIFGVAVARAYVFEQSFFPTFLVVAGMCAASVVPLFWSPWSPVWLFDRGVKAHRKNEFEKAVALYRKSLARGLRPDLGWKNLAIAYAQLKDEKHFREALGELRKINPELAREFD